MDKELKQKWIDALRSGEYKQTKGTLRDTNGHCCLGVLCDVAKPPEWDGERVVWFDDLWEEVNEETDELPAFLVRRWNMPDTETLMSMNDGTPKLDSFGVPITANGKFVWAGDNKTFAEIADYIEKEL